MPGGKNAPGKREVAELRIFNVIEKQSTCLQRRGKGLLREWKN